VLSVQYGSESDSDEGEADISKGVYIHPLHGMNGEVITGEPPSLWGGNPGLHWGWTECFLADRQLDVWEDAHLTRRFERWLGQELYEDAVELVFQSAWAFADTGRAQAIETVRVTVFGAVEGSRIIDFEFSVRNISSGTMLLLGSNPGSGLGIRINDDRKDVVLSGGHGIVTELNEPMLSPYMDFSYRDDRRSTYSGVMILQHPANPGYAKPNWTVEGDRTLVAGVPESERMRLAPGDSVRFGYRLVLHQGYGPSLNLSKVYSDYMREVSEK
jgi:hypothetical protein